VSLVLLSHVFSKIAILRKTCVKDCVKKQTVENQALESFFTQKLELLKIKDLHDVCKVLKIKHLRGFLRFYAYA
jgi:DNA-binding Xre family transcriptional regulator